MEMTDELMGLLDQYGFPAGPVSAEPLGCGHINETLLIRTAEGGAEEACVLQRINRYVFRKPWELMENVTAVTEHIRRKLTAEGLDPDRLVLTVLPTKTGESFVRDAAGEYWRMTRYISRSVCFQEADEALFAEAGRAFGEFQRLLEDFPAERLKETIPGFHDTRARYRAFAETVKADPVGRAAACRPEIEKVLSREKLAGAALSLLERGELLLRVTHNDTKLNNILFDRDSRRALCVIDLDTVMPGLAMNDFGDAIRFGASTAAEDEPDLSRVHFDPRRYEAYLRGYLQGCGDSLTARERETLPLGALLMTYEVGLRFLGDYLEGDVYFRTEKPEHNLIRCRTQLKLLEEMENFFKY